MVFKDLQCFPEFSQQLNLLSPSKVDTNYITTFTIGTIDPLC